MRDKATGKAKKVRRSSHLPIVSIYRVSTNRKRMRHAPQFYRTQKIPGSARGPKTFGHKFHLSERHAGKRCEISASTGSHRSCAQKRSGARAHQAERVATTTRTSTGHSTGCWLGAAGSELLAQSCWLRAAGSELLAQSCWLGAAGSELLARSCWLRAAGGPHARPWRRPRSRGPWPAASRRCA
jgi:hypothetical protein